jgi:hypothetical protein
LNDERAEPGKIEDGVGGAPPPALAAEAVGERSAEE